MGWTTPKTWATNDGLGASTLNTHLRDNLLFLFTPPMCRVFNSATISVATTTAVALTFDSERFDTDTMHSTSSNTGRITATTAGKYLVGAHINWSSNTTGLRRVQLRYNGGTNIALQDIPAGTGEHMSVSTLYAMSAGDYVDVVVYQESGSTLNVENTAAFSSEFWAVFQGG